MTMQQAADNSGAKATRIFNCLVKQERKLRQELMFDPDASPLVPQANNISTDQE